MSSLGDFSKKMLRLDVKKNIADAMRAYTLKVERNLKLLSPVDTGQYRANHRITIGNKSNFISYGVRANSSADILQSYTDITQPIFIQNNLPYAMRIEGGWSNQAPNGVYSQAISKDKFTVSIL